MPDETCRGVKTDGSPCSSSIGLVGGYCIQHDPGRRHLLDQAVENSIATRAERAALRRAIMPDGIPSGPPRTVSDCITWSAWAMNAAATGVIPARTAETVAKLGTVFLAGLKHRDLEREAEELRQEVRALKKAAKAAKR